MIWCEGRLLLQLRDFKPEVADPGQWGLFGGHLDALESPDEGLRRELSEEIGWIPQQVLALGDFDEEDRRIIGYCATLEIPLSALLLGEGHDLGVFTLEEVATNFLYSTRCKQSFPLTPITRRAVSLWSEFSPPTNR